MRSNYSILEANTLAGFQFDDTKELYLRGAQKDDRRAFWMAVEWEEKLRPALPFIAAAAEMHRNNPHSVASPEVVTEQVMRFIMDRHFNACFPQEEKCNKAAIPQHKKSQS